MMRKMKNLWADFDENPESEITRATQDIYAFIENKFTRSEKPTALRGSAATMCVKRRWYQNKGFKATPLAPRKIVNFMLGDLTERVLVYFIENACVGEGKLYKEVFFGDEDGFFDLQGRYLNLHKQIESSFKIGGHEVKCHFDGLGLRHDGKWELIEIKSSSEFGFQKFVKEGPGDYLKQAHAYMLTEKCRELGVESVRFFFLKKNTGHVVDKNFPFSMNTAKKVINDFKISMQDKEPPAPFKLAEEKKRKKPTGRLIAQFPCNYCPYLSHCHGSYEKVFKKSGYALKPVFVFNQTQGG